MQLTKEEVIHLYYEMRKIRRFEETVKEKSGTDIVGPTHLYIGEEAIAVGVCHHLTKQDYVTSTHRGHGHTLAKGARIDRSLAELYGRSTGYCKGKGGSMHLADFSVGMLGANGVVGGGFNIATGAALAIQQRGGKEVAVCFFGDGSSNRGTFHEAVNLAASWKLPVVFVCENNGWASTTRFSESGSVPQLSERAKAYGIVGVTIDGNDVELVQKTAKDLIERARRGEGPSILECVTYRIEGHFLADPQLYRTKEEVQAQYETNDPIKRFKEKIRKNNFVTEIELEQIDANLEVELEAAVLFAELSPYPKIEEALEDIFVGEVTLYE
ncbi:thiamine pyrophosphate-dependent dehydrogenase E1 component subunit alpha [Enterococcus sp. DIV1314a]|uniref:thiamine pyrophosphate-dependent dehydrogenase E1 component subunit alpha n=1 Tax=Enterococcus sp. DIV1314a TaxID=2774660 RepID=UPI003F21B25C